MPIAGKDYVRKVRAKTRIFTRDTATKTGMQKKNRTVERKNYIYKYILCSMFDLIVAVVVIVWTFARSKVVLKRLVLVVVFVVVVVVDFIIMHSTYVFFIIIVRLLIHTRCLLMCVVVAFLIRCATILPIVDIEEMMAGLGCLRWTEYNLFVSFRLSRCLLSLNVLVFFSATFLKPSCVHTNRHTYNILSIAALCSTNERQKNIAVPSIWLIRVPPTTMTMILQWLLLSLSCVCFCYSQLRRLRPINIVPIKFQNSQTNTVCVWASLFRDIF